MTACCEDGSMSSDRQMDLLASALIFVGVFGLFFWYLRRVDRRIESQMSAEELERASEAKRKFMRGFWRAQSVFAVFVASMFGVVVVALAREGYWQVALVASPFLPLIIWGIRWSWRGGDNGNDE